MKFCTSIIGMDKFRFSALVLVSYWNVRSVKKLRKPLPCRNTLTRFEYDAEDETVEKLLREAVEKTLKDKEVDVVDETVIKNSNLPFEFSYSLNISGTHLDKNWILNFTTAMAAAFSAKYPGRYQHDWLFQQRKSKSLTVFIHFFVPALCKRYLEKFTKEY